MAGRPCASWVKIQAQARVVLETSRRSVVAEDPSVSDSALRRQQAKVRISVALRNRNRNLQLASQSRRRLRARLQVKRAARKKGGKAPMVNNLVGRPHQEVEHQLLADHHQKVERPPLQPSGLKGSQSAARKSLKKNHHRQDHNKGICDSGSGTKIPEPLFCCSPESGCVALKALIPIQAWGIAPGIWFVIRSER
jgi:hypothetical protein